MASLVAQASRLTKDIKTLQRELASDPEAYLQSKKRIENNWSVETIVKEMFDLSGNFKDYLHGLVKPPSDN
jgi:hypothetical protein